MPRKPLKQPPSVNRPFPWTCHECGKATVDMATIQYDAEVRHDGRLHTFPVPDLVLPVCQSCGARVFTSEVDRQINLALRKHIGLLTPHQIREAITRIGQSQATVARHLGIAQESLSRWVNDVQIQNKSMDTCLRVYFAFPAIRAVLADQRQMAGLGLIDCSMAEVPNSPSTRA